MPRSAKGPVSVVLTSQLRRQVEKEAERRGLGLSPALRVLVAERLRDLSDDAELARAERWQRAQAWASWDDPANGHVEWDAVEAAFTRRPRHRRRR